MAGKEVLRKIVVEWMLAICILGVFCAGSFDALIAEATPIRPDIRKLLEQAPDQNPQFVPARAGWDGPEAAKTPESSPNPVLEKFSPAASARAARASLITAAIPDWRVVIALIALILMLRKARVRHDVLPTPSITAQSTELNRAA